MGYTHVEILGHWNSFSIEMVLTELYGYEETCQHTFVIIHGTEYSSAKMWNVYLRDLFEMHMRIELTENPLVDKQI